MIETFKVKQYNSTQKVVICVDKEPIAITRSSKRAGEIISYISGYDVKIADGKLKKKLDHVRKELNKSK